MNGVSRVRVMVFNVTFNNIPLNRGGQFNHWRKPEYLEKTTDFPQVIDKLAHNIVSPFIIVCIFALVMNITSKLFFRSIDPIFLQFPEGHTI
jgi:hypothetical protein